MEDVALFSLVEKMEYLVIMGNPVIVTGSGVMFWKS